MLTLLFKGWFQCRLPTNPDPADELRGVSGYTFAVGAEKNLDRIIRFNKDKDFVGRSHGPDVGVSVHTVFLDGQLLPNHVLAGARVDLLDEPKFDAANGIVAKEGGEPIVPFHLQVASRESGAILRARQAVPGPSPTQETAPARFSELFSALVGVPDPVVYRRERLTRLEAEHEETEDPVARSALEKRIRELRIPLPEEARAKMFTERRLLFLNGLVAYDITLNGQRVSGSRELLGGEPNEDSPWRSELWVGTWDADALCGFVHGVLKVPFKSQAGA